MGNRCCRSCRNCRWLQNYAQWKNINEPNPLRRSRLPCCCRHSGHVQMYVCCQDYSCSSCAKHYCVKSSDVRRLRQNCCCKHYYATFVNSDIEIT
ncbi:hypothetical protein BOX15_Mlig004935g1 [Macrostomum lignano]|uniref:Uncharacterized protein n=1 Tax=Macrostomum lignano TaxID=282301 RepID=A0A267FDI0_9PLAT|nr:hypothetical protein BOX15_Mlig004935g1 [Macrostomum lignano]